MNSRSLPQNKAPFGLDPLAKFAAFAQRSVPTIWVLSSLMEGTIRTRRLSGIDSNLATAVGVARDGRATLWSHSLSTSDPPPPTAIIGLVGSRAPPLLKERDKDTG